MKFRCGGVISKSHKVAR